MIILLTFAFLAGFVTVLSPCVLPVLPLLLSAGASYSRKRTIGILMGLVLSFLFFTLAIHSLIKILPISPNLFRTIAISIVALFGLFLLFPSLNILFAKKTASIAQAGENLKQYQDDQGGFWGGFILGVSLGLLWTPCAGPILAAVAVAAATSQVTWEIVAIATAYILGGAIPMFLLMAGSRKLFTSSKFFLRHSEGIRQIFGLVMVVTALALYLNLDLPLQNWIAKYIPTIYLEDDSLINKESKNNLKTAMPPFKGIEAWINSPPLTPQSLQGKVVLVDFWTYSCINCLRTLPYLTDWYNKYKDLGLVIVGMHTPEFQFEKSKSNVEEATKKLHVDYPVALDNNYATWTAYDNHYWPAHYLFDQEGFLQEKHFGEGGYLETENKIRSLLGLKPLEGNEPSLAKRLITPETYLGKLRAESYSKADLPGEDQVVLKGPWTLGKEEITADQEGSELLLNFKATRVYLVMSSEQKNFVEVFLNDKPLPKEFYTADMDAQGRIVVEGARKFDVIDLKGQYGRHLLRLKFGKGIKAYAFTFGDE